MHPKYKRMLEGLAKKETIKKKKRVGDKWSLYILKCGDGSLYTGITNDIERRFRMHQNGSAARYTRTRRPVELVYQETCGTRSRALIRECEIKEWPRKKKEKLFSGTRD